MPFHSSVEPDTGIGVITLTGEVDASQIIEALASLPFEQTRRSGYSLLWDGREITSMVINPEDVQRVADRVEHFRGEVGEGRGAWVVRNETYDMIARLIAKMTGAGRERRSFRDLAAARQWLLEKS